MKNHKDTLHKIARFSNHLIFNIRCNKHGLIPISLQVKQLIHTKRGYDISAKASKQFLQERIHTTHYKKIKFKKEAEILEESLADKLDEGDFNNIVKMSQLCAEKTFCETKERQIEKFNRLKKKKK